MGTPEFAVPSLHKLVSEGYEVVGVVTQPDRPKGRKRVMTPPPVKVEAERFGIRVLQPERLRRPEGVEALRELKPDLIVTAAYGQILPKSVLEMPIYGCINIHASLLPKYRGGAPIHYAVMNGDSLTGVTIMYMAEGLDTGDIISKVEVPILLSDTTGTMFEKLSLAGAELLQKTLPDLLKGRIQAVPQLEEEAVYSPNIKREDELIDWSKSALHIYNHVRGLNPFPGAFTSWNGEVLKVWNCAIPEAAWNGRSNRISQESDPVPGTVIHTDERGIAVHTGDGVLYLTNIQPSGKKAMEVVEFLRGAGIEIGTVLGNTGEPSL
jgi:methionyl-tRNA formyltransferase